MKTLIALLFGMTSMLSFAQTEKEYVSNPETEPSYVGGTNALYEFIANNVNYPAEAIENHIEGKVYTSFLVNEDGTLSNIQILRSPDETLSAEATRLIQKMPNWKPGMDGGKTVRTKITLPISFTLSTNE